MAETTQPAAKGVDTSEGRLTIAAQVVGFLLATFGALLTKYAENHPGNPWTGVALSSMGVLLSVVTLYGYTKGRAIVKNAMIQQGIDWAAPLVEAALEKALTKQLGPVATVTTIPPGVSAPQVPLAPPLNPK